MWTFELIQWDDRQLLQPLVVWEGVGFFFFLIIQENFSDLGNPKKCQLGIFSAEQLLESDESLKQKLYMGIISSDKTW